MPDLPRFAKPAVVIAGVAAAIIGGAKFAQRGAVRRWQSNPDPTDGRPPKLRDATTVMVPRTDGAKIATHIVGDPATQPTMVLVHGVTSNHDDWGYVADRLVSLGYAIVAVDQRGHGDSTVGSDGFGIGPQAADLAAAIEHHDLTDVVLAGHSMGGMAALGLASWHPDVLAERVAGLGLVSTAAALARFDQRAAIRFGALGLEGKLPLEPKQMRLAAATFIFGKRPALALIDHSIASYLRCPDSTRTGATQGLSTYDVRPHLAHIECPALVICGDHDRLTPLAFSEELAAALPNADLQILQDLGHMVIFEDPDLVADLLDTFAQSVMPS